MAIGAEVEDPGIEIPEPSELAVNMLAEFVQRLGVALTKNAPIKKKWARYVLRKYGVYQGDDPDHELVQIGGNQPILAKFIDQLRATVFTELVSDFGEMDFFKIATDWPGLEDLARNITELLRMKFRSMKPDNADNFYEMFDQTLDDLFTIGNCVGATHHEMIEGELDTDPIIQGPVTDRLDPFNVAPEDVTVNKMENTNVFIYAPISDEELDVIYPEHAAAVRDKISQVKEAQDPDAPKPAQESGDIEEDEVEGLYPRRIYLCRLPVYSIIRAHYKDTGMTRETLIAQLAQEFGFDPQKALTATWWHCEWIGEFLLKCEPYKIALPKGFGPLQHLTLFPRNGYVWGHGMYDRAGMDERIHNSLDRSAITITKNAANPPIWVYEEMMDDEWLTEHETNPSIEPGEIIKCKINPNARRPYEYGDVNVAALPYIQAQLQQRSQAMRELTGISAIMEGFDESKTATQTSLNLQQSQMLATYVMYRVVYLFLKPLVERAYVVARQAMVEAPGLVEQVPVTYAEDAVRRAVPVSHEHMRQLEYFRVHMTGAMSQGNKAAQLESLTQAWNMFVQTGSLDIAQFQKMYLSLTGISDAASLLINVPQEVMAARIYAQRVAPGASGASGIAPLPQAGSVGPTGAQMMIGGGGNNNPQGNNQMPQQPVQ